MLLSVSDLGKIIKMNFVYCTVGRKYVKAEQCLKCLKCAPEEVFLFFMKSRSSKNVSVSDILHPCVFHAYMSRHFRVASTYGLYKMFYGSVIHAGLAQYTNDSAKTNVRVECDYKGVKIVGIIDKINFERNEIWEFKTGTGGKVQEQLSLYKWMAEETKLLQNPELIAAFVRDDTIMVVKVKPVDVSKLLERAPLIKEMIDKELVVSEDVPKSKLCNRCEFKDGCNYLREVL
jgi:CRISPR/Cas system-associated exonuclease Cas4 (RecB family)